MITGSHFGSPTVTGQLSSAAPLANQLGPSASVANQLGPATPVANQLGPSESVANQLGPSTSVAKQLGPSASVANQLGASASVANQLISTTSVANQFSSSVFGANQFSSHPAVVNQFGSPPVAINHNTQALNGSGQFIAQVSPAVLQTLNPAQIDNCLELSKVRRKRGRPPKDRNKQLEQLRAGQSPVKMRKLLPKGPCFSLPGAATSSSTAAPVQPSSTSAQSADVKGFSVMSGLDTQNAAGACKPQQLAGTANSNGVMANGNYAVHQLANSFNANQAVRQQMPTSIAGMPAQAFNGAGIQMPNGGGFVQTFPVNQLQGFQGQGQMTPGHILPGQVQQFRPQFVQAVNGNFGGVFQAVQQPQPHSNGVFQNANTQFINLPRQFFSAHGMQAQALFSPVAMQHHHQPQQQQQQQQQQHHVVMPQQSLATTPLIGTPAITNQMIAPQPLNGNQQTNNIPPMLHNNVMTNASPAPLSRDTTPMSHDHHVMTPDSLPSDEQLTPAVEPITIAPIKQ